MSHTRGWVALPAGLAPVALIGGWTIAAAHQPRGYSSVRDTISALAARGATNRWIMTAALTAVGLCYLATAVGLARSRPAGRILLAVGGAATVGVAALPQPSAGHAPAATIAFVTLAVRPAASALFGRRVSIAVTAVLLVLLGCFLVSLAVGNVQGLSERAVAGAEALWPAVAALVLVLGHTDDRTDR